MLTTFSQNTIGGSFVDTKGLRNPQKTSWSNVSLGQKNWAGIALIGETDYVLTTENGEWLLTENSEVIVLESQPSATTTWSKINFPTSTWIKE